MANKTVEGQLRPLSKRLSPEKQLKRAAKIQARKSVAEYLATENAITRNAAIQGFNILYRRQQHILLSIAFVALTVLLLFIWVLRG